MALGITHFPNLFPSSAIPCPPVVHTQHPLAQHKPASTAGSLAAPDLTAMLLLLPQKRQVCQINANIVEKIFIASEAGMISGQLGDINSHNRLSRATDSF